MNELDLFAVLGLCGDNKELIQKLTGYLECHG